MQTARFIKRKHVGCTNAASTLLTRSNTYHDRNAETQNVQMNFQAAHVFKCGLIFYPTGSQYKFEHLSNQLYLHIIKWRCTGYKFALLLHRAVQGSGVISEGLLFSRNPVLRANSSLTIRASLTVASQQRCFKPPAGVMWMEPFHWLATFTAAQCILVWASVSRDPEQDTRLQKIHVWMKRSELNWI